MKYNRTLSAEFAELLTEKGKLRWLFNFVKTQKELDFLTANVKSTERILIYRGLSKIFQIKKYKTKQPGFDADRKFKEITPHLFTKTIYDNFQNEFLELIDEISNVKNLHKYYENKKEGFYQNELSRKYGINSSADSEFVIIDKEVVISYKDEKEKDSLLTPIQKKYQRLKQEISLTNSKKFAMNRKIFGNELDFLALDRDGNVLLIEYKHGEGNTAGIYWSPLQVGVYYEIFNLLDKKELEESIFEMLKQKQNIGLISSDWIAPKEIKGIIPVVMISQFNENRGDAKKFFDEVLKEATKTSEFQFLKKLQLFKFNKGQLIKL